MLLFLKNFVTKDIICKTKTYPATAISTSTSKKIVKLILLLSLFIFSLCVITFINKSVCFLSLFT